MQIYLFPLVLIFGLIIGSFLNALIYRLNSGESIAKGRSKCPNCQHALNVLDLIPVISFLSLRGRCRYCRKSISWQYPIVELITAVLFVLFFNYNFNQSSISWELLVFCLRDWLVVSSLVVVFVYDFKWMLIPDSVVLPAVIVTLMINILMGQLVTALLLSLAIGFGFFAIQYFISRGTWIGGGDLRLGLLMGAILSWPNLIMAIFFSYIIGAIVGIWLLASKKANRKTELPFGVFLAPVTIFVMLFGNKILAWYLSLSL